MTTVFHTLDSLATLVAGQLSGDGDLKITGVAPYETAASDQITFAQTVKHLKKVARSQAGAVLVPGGHSLADRNTIAVENPQVAFIKLVHLFHPAPEAVPGIHGSAVIGPNSRLGRNPSVGSHVSIGDQVQIGDRAWIEAGVVVEDDVVIGDDVHLFANVTIRSGSRLGDRIVMHPGGVIGADGFGFVPGASGAVKVPQIGHVQIDDDVEIGANCTIDRATFGKTWIQQGVKLDNQVHIAHNCTVGAHSLIMALAGISGSVKIGKGAIIAGHCGISDHLEIGDGAIVGPMAGITKSIPPGETRVGGVPALPFKKWLRVQRIINHLPELKKRLEKLEKILFKDPS